MWWRAGFEPGGHLTAKSTYNVYPKVVWKKKTKRTVQNIYKREADGTGAERRRMKTK